MGMRLPIDKASAFQIAHELLSFSQRIEEENARKALPSSRSQIPIHSIHFTDFIFETARIRDKFLQTLGKERVRSIPSRKPL